MMDPRDKLLNKIRTLKKILDTKGVSDSGTEYRVYSFSSCHVGDTSLAKALDDLFSEVKDKTLD